MEVKGHKKQEKKIKKLFKPWPRKFVPSHTKGSCPYCHVHVKSVEAHIDSKHEHKKPLKIKGKLHGPQESYSKHFKGI
jgi:hypothetical protein